MQSIQPKTTALALLAGLILAWCVPLYGQDRTSEYTDKTLPGCYEVMEQGLVDFDRFYRIYLSHEDPAYLGGEDYTIPVVIQVICGDQQLPYDLPENDHLTDAFGAIQKYVRKLQPRRGLYAYRKYLPGLLEAIQLARFDEAGQPSAGIIHHTNEELAYLTHTEDQYLTRLAALCWNTEKYLNFFVVEHLGDGDILYSPMYRFFIVEKQVLEREITPQMVSN